MDTDGMTIITAGNKVFKLAQHFPWSGPKGQEHDTQVKKYFPGWNLIFIFIHCPTTNKRGRENIKHFPTHTPIQPTSLTNTYSQPQTNHKANKPKDIGTQYNIGLYNIDFVKPVNDVIGML